MIQNDHIAIHSAKEELGKINSFLKNPHLLIGGIAINQYVFSRTSQDIDLICDFNTITNILKELYPTSEWHHEDTQNDEYRPSIRVVHRLGLKGAIVLGPKITERVPYANIDWSVIRENAEPFLGLSAVKLDNILVPTAHALAYMKLVSFMQRTGNQEKVLQDLVDFCDLTNHKKFSIAGFRDLIRRLIPQNSIRSKLYSFLDKSREHSVSLVERSSLMEIVNYFLEPTSSLMLQPTYTYSNIESIIESIQLCLSFKKIPKKEAKKYIDDIFNCVRIEIGADSTFSSAEDFKRLFDKLFYSIYN